MRRKSLCLLLLILILSLTGCRNGSHIGGHNYGQWQVVKEATCTEDGLQERVCTCGSKETEVILTLGHEEVIDEARAASCTKTGLTEGRHCSRCKLVLRPQEEIPASHVLETIPGIAPTCTRAGKEEGAYCTLCGETVVKQKKIRHEGHNYVAGVCTKCGENQPDMAASIVIDQLNESGQANFITKKAYPGGTTVTFQAFVPSGSSWWAVSWTQNANDTGLYNWADGLGVRMDITQGKWQECTVTLPDDGNSYYLYFVGAKGEWGGRRLMIDDVVITDANGEVLGTDSFTTDVSSGLFSAVKVNPSSGDAVVFCEEVCTGHWTVKDNAVAATCDQDGLTDGSHCGNCGKILLSQEVIPATGHTWVDGKCSVCGKDKENLVAAIVIDLLNENAPMNFITKEAYPGGSTVTFAGYVPYGVNWWAISWTTDPADTSLYKWSEGMGQQMTSVSGQWATYTVTLPDDGNSYYVYFVGEKGKWNEKELRLNDFTVTGADGKVLAKEDFDNGVKNSIFSVITNNPTNNSIVVSAKALEDPCKNGHTVVIDKAVEPTCTKVGLTEGKHCSVCGYVIVAQEEIPAKPHTYDESGKCQCGAVKMNRGAAINIDRLSEDAGKMSFITRIPYGGGSSFTIRALVPSGVGWWAVNWTTDPANTDLYAWIVGNGKSIDSTYGVWKDYTVTLPDDGQTYYLYIVGAKGEWGGKELIIDKVTVTNAIGEAVATETFDDGLYSGIFKITDDVSIVREVEVIQCDHVHTTKEPDKASTCTEAGYTGATVCNDCGTTIQERVILPLADHQWEHGECSVCHKPQETVNHVLALYVDVLDEGSPMNLITRTAYPGGSTVSFKAYVPAGVNWWAVCWTTDPADVSLYKWTEGKGQPMTSKENEWADYSVTLPNDGNTYYVYYVGAKGEWRGNALLLDDVVITAPDGTAYTENFENGFEDCLFSVTAQSGSNTVVELQAVETGSGEPEPAKNHVAALYVDLLNEGSPINLITKTAYPGGSTVSFKAFVPADASWWAVCWTTDPADVSLYKWTEGKGQPMTSKENEWADYSVTLPNDGNTYYVYYVGAKGEWNGNALLLDNVVITAPDGTTYTENFENGFEDCLFSVTAQSGSNTVVELQAVETGSGEPEPAKNHVAALYVDLLNEGSPINLITKTAYPGGSTVSFKAYVPAGVNWWAVCWTTDPADVSLYKWTEGKGQSMTSKENEWADYSVTLPNDGNTYYVYFVGAKGEWKGNALLLDDVAITAPVGTAYTENFENGFENCLFSVTAQSGSNTVVELQAVETGSGEESESFAASILIDQLNESDSMNFITKAAYSGGSTATFEAYVPSGAAWWAVCWTTDPTDVSLYKWTEGKGQSMTSQSGKWAEYSVTLPDDGNSYYVYIVGAKGEWNGKTLLIDNLTVTAPDGTKVTESFDNEFDQWIFNIVANNPSNGNTVISKEKRDEE